MFKLYEEKCIHEFLAAVKEKIYYHVFSIHFNNHFMPLAKDVSYVTICRITFKTHKKQKQDRIEILN